MIEGFLTRPSTDLPIRYFTESAKGILHHPTIDSEVDRFVSKKWPTFEEKKQLYGWAQYPCAVFGILRGTDIIIKECEKRKHDYYYFDHCYLYAGYKHSNHPIFNSRIYRIVKNAQSLTKIDTLSKEDNKRVDWYLNKKNISINKWKKDGGHILVLPPSLFMKRFYNMHVVLQEYGIQKGKKVIRNTTDQQYEGLNRDKTIFIDKESNYDNDEFWEKQVVNKLKKHTDREIRVRYKDSKNTFQQDLVDAWAVVSSQSIGAVDALIAGVPSFCEDTSAALPMSLTDLSKIETPIYPDNREEWMRSLLANQYTLDEIKSGVAYNRLKDK
jgi:hypothetical protein